MKCSGICAQGCFLLSFEQQICAFGAVELNGGGWRLKMELSFHTCQNKFQHCFSCFFCNMFYVFKSSSLCVCIFAICINYDSLSFYITEQYALLLFF